MRSSNRNNFLICLVGILVLASLSATSTDEATPVQRHRDTQLRNRILSQIGKLTEADGSENDEFGISIAVDGNTAVVGASADGGPNRGAYVFVKPPSGWKDMTQVADLTPADDGVDFGASVSISGNVVVVGAPGTNGFTGAVYVFVEPANGWQNMTQTAELRASDGRTQDSLGSSVSVSGNTIAAGAQKAMIGANSQQGAEYVFVEPTSGWVNMTQTAKLTASDGVAKDWLGWTSGISGDTVVASAPNWNNYQGAEYVFVKPAGGWANMTQTAKLLASDGKQMDDLGDSVAITGDTIVAGAPIAEIGQKMANGAAYVFAKPPTGWANGTQTAKLVSSYVQANQLMGVSSAVSLDAIVVGAPYATVNGNVQQGAAYAFLKPAGGWKNMVASAELVASDGQGGDSLGWGVAVSDTDAFAGAYEATVGSNPAEGAAYVFEKK